MKKIVYLFAIIFLVMIVIVNIVFTTYLNTSEQAIIQTNHLGYIIGVLLVGILIYFITHRVNQYLYKDESSDINKKMRKKLFIVAFTMYIIFNIIWVVLVNPKVIGDSVHVCNLAQTFYGDNSQDFLQNPTYVGVSLKEYMQAYPHQITLAFIYSIFFKIIHFDVMEILRVWNVIGNIAIVIAIYKIGNQLSKKYKMNKVRLLLLILTFISLPMLTTYIYGDIPSLALCLFSVYFMMRYTETKKIIYPIVASVFTMIAYMMRMNSLIFIIATGMYLVLNIWKEWSKEDWKNRILQISIICIYLIIAMFPASLVKNYYFQKYDLDKDKIYPNNSYLLMAMEEGPRGNGWYNENIAGPALKEPEKMKIEYTQKIKDRLTYFSENWGYTLKFYTNKITSMWTENTYAAVRNNTLPDNTIIDKFINPLTFYQKEVLILICTCSIIILVQNRKNLSYELIFLATIFIGGFAFHILWEAKSRYIIPYIVVLMPMASVEIQKFQAMDSKIIKKIKTFSNSIILHFNKERKQV